jgi:hypothetical protein
MRGSAGNGVSRKNAAERSDLRRMGQAMLEVLDRVFRVRVCREDHRAGPIAGGAVPRLGRVRL